MTALLTRPTLHNAYNNYSQGLLHCVQWRRQESEVGGKVQGRGVYFTLYVCPQTPPGLGQSPHQKLKSAT